MADSSEDASAHGPSKASQKDVWEVLESISKIIAALGIPIVLGVGGWIIGPFVNTRKEERSTLRSNGALRTSDSATVSM